MPGLVPADNKFTSPRTLPPVLQIIYAVLVLGLVLAVVFPFIGFSVLIPEGLIGLIWYQVYVKTTKNTPNSQPDAEKIGCWSIPVGLCMLTFISVAISIHYQPNARRDDYALVAPNLVLFHIASFGLQWAWFRYYGFKQLHPTMERDTKRRVQAKAEFLRQFQETEWTVSNRNTMLKAMDEVLKTPEDEWLHPFNLFTYEELEHWYKWLRAKTPKPDPVPHRPIDPRQKTFTARAQDISPPPPPPETEKERLEREAREREAERKKAAQLCADALAILLTKHWPTSKDASDEMELLGREERWRRYYSKPPALFRELDEHALNIYMAHMSTVVSNLRAAEELARTSTRNNPDSATLEQLAERKKRAIQELYRLQQVPWSNLDALLIEQNKVTREFSRARHHGSAYGWHDHSLLEYPLLDDERLYQYSDWLKAQAARIKRGDLNSRSDAVLLGKTTDAGEPVFLSHYTRQDLYIIGRKQSGKTTMMENIIVQDFKRNAGMASIDPHGDTSERLLHFVPGTMADRTIYWAPAEFVIPINIMHAENPDDAARIANDIKLIFQRTSEGWGPQMDAVLLNAVFTLLEIPGTTFLDIRRLFIDADWRIRTVVPNLKDPDLKSFWEYEWPSYERANAARPVLTRMTSFLRYPLVRQVLGVPNPPFDIGKEIDKGTGMIFNISKGLLNPEVSALFGVVIVSQIQNAIMRRAKIPETQRQPFYLYVDEFQNFATSAFDEILSEAGKYQIFLTLVNQGLWQLTDQRLKKSVNGNITEYLLFAGLESSDLLALSGKLGEQGIKYAQSLVPKKDAVYRDSYGIVTKFDCQKPLTPPSFSFAEQIRKNSRRYCASEPPPSQCPPPRDSTPPAGDASRPGSSPKPN